MSTAPKFKINDLKAESSPLNRLIITTAKTVLFEQFSLLGNLDYKLPIYDSKQTNLSHYAYK